MGISESRRRSKCTRQAWKGVAPKWFAVCLDEAGAEIGDHAGQRMTRAEARLGRKADEPIGGLCLEHERVHDVLSRVINSDEQTVPPAPDEDHLAVHAEKPTPCRPSSVDSSSGVFA